MKTWQVIGVDSETGKGRSLEVQAETERQAQISANDQGLMVQSVEQIVGKTISANPIPDRSKNQLPELYEPVSNNAHTKPKHVRFFGIPMPYFGEEKRKYADRGVNTIGEMAAAVFVGMLAFSCISPFIFVYFSMFLIVWGMVFSRRY